MDPDDVTLVLADPPYGIAVDTDQRRLSQQKGHTGHRVYPPVAGDLDPFDPAPLLAAYPSSTVVLFGANHYADRLPIGVWLVWVKRDASPFHAAAELAWHNGGGRPVDVFDYPISRTKAVDGVLHPTQKPADLMRWIVDRFTVRGDLVVDPYAGSGPVAQACQDLGRRYVGVEVDPVYVAATVARCQQLSLDVG